MSESTEDGAKSQDHAAGVRAVMLHLPEDEGEGLGFTLTRTMWDPYPWVRDVVDEGRAAGAGLRAGDCVLQADGRDLLGLPVGQVAGVIRGDGGGHGVSLLVWSCGASPQEDPELLWSAGGGARGERSRRALGGVLRALACCVCAATAAGARARAAQCTRGHIYCAGCRARLQRCALCRESLPALDTPQARNLVAEQVFDAIASVYELKDHHRVSNLSASASTSPHRSPVPTLKSPASLSQRNSPLNLRKTVQFGLTVQPHHGSDISLNRPKPRLPEFIFKRIASASVQDNDTESQIVNAENPNRDTQSPRNKRNECQNENQDFQNGGCQTSNITGGGINIDHSSQYVNEISLNHKPSITNQCCQTSDWPEARTHCSQNTDRPAKPSQHCHYDRPSTPNHCCQISENTTTYCCQNPDKPATIQCCHRSIGANKSCSTYSPNRHCCSSDSHVIQNHSCHPSENHFCHNIPEGVVHSCCLNPSVHPQMTTSQQGLNCIPPGGACGLQHRLVARLRPATSLADLRPPSSQGGLSKSWNNLHTAARPPRERTSSVSDLPAPDQSAAEEPVYVMSSQPVLVWAYPQ